MTRWTAADAQALNERYAGQPAADVLRAVFASDVGKDLAVVSSFGAESSVLLDLVAQANPAAAILFIDTEKLFDETLEYRDQLISQLGLTNVQTIKPDPVEVARDDPDGKLWQRDTDACCHLRKVVTLDRALEPFSGWVTGRKAFQAVTRTNLELFEFDGKRLKVNPLADWTRDRLLEHIEARNLPMHPLVPYGYLSIGCLPCTSPVQPGEDARAGRWRGLMKTECGLHLPLPAAFEYASEI